MTIEDVKKQTKKYADVVNLPKIKNIESMKSYNKAMELLTTKYPTTKLQEISEINQSGVLACANRYRMRLNPSFFNNPQKTYESAVVDFKKSREALIKKYEFSLELHKGKLSAKTERAYNKEINKLKEQLKFSRYTVTREKTAIMDTTTHEYAHVLTAHLFNPKLPTFDHNKYLIAREAYIKAKENGDIYKISVYALQGNTVDEFFAECFTLHTIGDEKNMLPDYINKMITEILK